LFLALEAIWRNNSPAFFADHTAIRQSLRALKFPRWAYVAEYIAIFDAKKSRRTVEAIRSDNSQSHKVPLQVSHMAPKAFFVLEYSGIGVAEDSALLVLTHSTTFCQRKKGAPVTNAPCTRIESIVFEFRL
jgi:hypothetical protein